MCRCFLTLICFGFVASFVARAVSRRWFKYFKLNKLRQDGWNWASRANKSSPCTLRWRWLLPSSRVRGSICFPVGSFRAPSLSLNTGNLMHCSVFHTISVQAFHRKCIWRKQLRSRWGWWFTRGTYCCCGFTIRCHTGLQLILVFSKPLVTGDSRLLLNLHPRDSLESANKHLPCDSVNHEVP